MNKICQNCIYFIGNFTCGYHKNKELLSGNNTLRDIIAITNDFGCIFFDGGRQTNDKEAERISFPHIHLCDEEVKLYLTNEINKVFKHDKEMFLKTIKELQKEGKI